MTTFNNLSELQLAKINDIQIATGLDADLIMSGIFEFGLDRMYRATYRNANGAKEAIVFHDAESDRAFKRGLKL